MSCKHKQVIRIVVGTNKKEYYCTAKQKEIGDYECDNCLLKLEENPYKDFINSLFGGFGR